MRISYHEDTDSIYIHFTEVSTLESEEVAPDTVLHFDEDGGVTGIEVYSEASERIDLSTFKVLGLDVDIADLEDDEVPEIVAYP